MWFHNFKLKKFFLLLMLPMIGICDTPSSSLIWQTTYYQSIPNQKEISPSYCKQHEPGTFIGVVQDQLAKGTLTDRQIKLDHFTFQEQIQAGIYFMQGTVLAHGKTAEGKDWEDNIRYYVYKLTEKGITQGVWSSGQCKGLYLGQVVKSS